MQTAAPLTEESLATIEEPTWDHRNTVPVDDEVYALLRQSFDYDLSDLEPEQVSSTVEESWVHDVVSIRAAYGDERFLVHFYLPKDVEPPYQAVVYWPPSSATFLKDSTRPSFPMGYFIPRSGSPATSKRKKTRNIGLASPGSPNNCTDSIFPSTELPRRNAACRRYAIKKLL